MHDGSQTDPDAPQSSLTLIRPESMLFLSGASIRSSANLPTALSPFPVDGRRGGLQLAESGYCAVGGHLLRAYLGPFLVLVFCVVVPCWRPSGGRGRRFKSSHTDYLKSGRRMWPSLLHVGEDAF